MNGLHEGKSNVNYVKNTFLLVIFYADENNSKVQLIQENKNTDETKTRLDVGKFKYLCGTV